MNIVSIAMSLLTPAVIGRIATALGVNPTIAQMAITAALPAILAGISGKAAQPAGLGVLTGLLGQQNSSTLGHLGDLIGGSNQASLVNAGTGALNSLFGTSTTGALAGAVSKFAGVPEAASGTLMGMLAPVALGTLAQQHQASGGDASGLATMLAGQKDNIAAALPKGFGDLLKGTGLLDSVMPSAPSMTAATPVATAAAAIAAVKGAAASIPTVAAAGTAAVDAVKAAAPAMAAKPMAAATAAMDTVKAAAPSMSKPVMPNMMPATPKASGGLPSWLLPAAAVVVLGALGWQFLSKRGPAIPAASAIIYNNVDVGGKAAALYEGLKTSVAGIKDEASATASLPKLREASSALADMSELAGKMPADGRKGLAGLFTTMLPGLQSLVTTAIKAPGAEGIVKQPLEQIIDRMKDLAKG